MTDDIQRLITEKLELVVDEKLKEYFREDAFKITIGTLVEGIVTKTIRSHLLNVDLNYQVAEATRKELVNKIKELAFPENSIPFNAIKNKEVAISATQITGGVHRKFRSRGIEDYASDCKLTVMDDNVVVENNLVALNANIKESLTVDGDLVVKGNVPKDSKFFTNIVDGVIERLGDAFEMVYKQSIVNGVLHTIKSQGLDVDQFSVSGKKVIEGNKIANNITDSNLQSVGYLKDLQVRGEALLHDSLYVGNKRVGINTDEPACAFSVWDEETEVVVKKHQKHTAFIGSSRDTTVVLGSNNSPSIRLLQNGSAQIDNLRIGTNKITSNPTKPNIDSDKGHIVLNSHPDIGRPVGWVCLGGNRWSPFGNCE